VISAVYLGFGRAVLSLFSNQQEVLDTANTYLPWMIIAPLISIWSYQLDGIFIGVGHTRQMQNAMVVSTLAYLVLVWLLLPLLGNHGLFLALSLFMGLRALTLLYYYPGIVAAIES
jgi:MATE family multidrug resistance protein